MQKEHLSLILPVYNPQVGWFSLVRNGSKQLMQALDMPVKVIMVNDGSDKKDAFTEVEEGETFQLIHSPTNEGKGAALRRGFDHAKGTVVMFTDVDFPYEIESMVAIARAIEQGADVSLGYRENDYYEQVPWFRKLLSEAFRFLLKSILRFPITDTQCGLKAMNQTGKRVFQETSIKRFLVDMEFIKRASKNKKLRIEPVVVKLRSDVEFSSMGVGVILTELINFIRIIFL